MRIITVPAALTALPDIARGVSQEIRARIGAGPLILNTRVVDTAPAPVLLAEFYTPSGRLYVELRRQVPGFIRGRHHVITADGTELFQAASLMEAVRLAREAGYRVFVPVTGGCQDRQDAADWHEWK